MEYTKTCAANVWRKSCERLIRRCIEMIVNSDVDIVTIEKALPQQSVKRIKDSRLALALSSRAQSNNAASNAARTLD